MQVAELLRSKGSTVATVTSETTIDQIIEVLRSANIGAVIVSTDGEAHRGHCVRARTSGALYIRLSSYRRRPLPRS